MSKTLVIQSHSRPLPHDWMAPCLGSVRSWAESIGADYRFLDDALFEYLSEELHARTLQQPVVASDLARLLVIREALEKGFETAVWCDADFLVFEPDDFFVPDSSYALGREVWIQDKNGKPAAYVKVHNAFVSFKRGNPFLAFYIHACERLLEQHDGPSAPQLIGPKFLSVIHNMIRCPVAERAGVMSPLLARDLIDGGGQVLDLFLRRSVETPVGLNLCASSIVSGELDNGEMEAVIELLLGSPKYFSSKMCRA